ncbi:ferredoxin [Candidatus Woesearchaeota archaeon]|jgi:ferredoxin|nr:ferredoxin [Candidatus Woesearchaeota archaeon]MBT4110297.1 ferredoxin [Candidatus Woesearchaeota archaeon]MBT4336179.1 ferredoxin [Candidatus Woesearchaeota archaeon]MBT4468842.1 ferredoxin [Candidatus Woesearchaeota archaeon]MBT6744839.1 ferredoxin [Candidatus Woesearchaeota archaeon]
MAKFKILHFKEECISCGACAAICPEFWEMDGEGMAQLKESKQVGDHWERIIDTEDARSRNQEAVDACPVTVIKLEELE